jgi:CRISPR-associated protein Cas5 subtype I-B
MIYIDISAEMAQFRNYFYNSSVVSYPFFPRTSVLGFLASILGLEHDSYYALFNTSQIGVCLKTPVMKETKTHNFLKTDGLAKNFHSQMKIEYLRNANDKPLMYRVYIEGCNEDEILAAIDNGRGYLRYLGTTECLAQIDDYNSVDYQELPGNETYYIDSVLPVDIIEELLFDDEEGFFHYEKNRIVYHFKENRVSLGVVDMLTETKRLQILARLKNDLSFFVSDETKVAGRLVKTVSKNWSDTVYVF